MEAGELTPVEQVRGAAHITGPPAAAGGEAGQGADDVAEGVLGDGGLEEGGGFGEGERHILHEIMVP